MKEVKNTKNLQMVPQMTWIDRTKKDLSRWKLALTTAENVLNPTRKLLYDLYSDTILDPHVKSVLDKRTLSVTNTKIEYKAEEKEYEDIEKIIETPFFEKIVSEIINSKYYGFSLLQIDFKLQSVELIDRRYVKPEFGMVVSWPYDTDGIDFTKPPYTNNCVAIGDKKDLGLLLIASTYAILKKGNVSDWATFNERYAMPFRYVNIPTGASKQDINNASDQLKAMGSNGYGVFPPNLELKLAESKSSGNNTNFKAFADFCNAEISKLFLGQTMTTENGSSLSQAKVHKEVEDKISRADKLFVEKVLNTDIKKLMIAQGIVSDGDQGEFKFSDEEEEMSLESQMKMWIEASKLAPIDTHEFSERFGVKFVGTESPKQEKQEEQGKEEGGSTSKEKPNQDPKNQNTVVAKPDKKKPESLKLSWWQKALQLVGFFEPAPIMSKFEGHDFDNPQVCCEHHEEGIKLDKNRDELEKEGLLPFVIANYEKRIKKALKQIYKNPYKINKELFDISNDQFQKGVSTEFTLNTQFIKLLQDNAIFFSAHKTYHQVFELSDAIMDGDRKRSFREFRKAVQPIVNNYNQNWLKTEFNAVVRSARMANVYRKAIETISLYPNIEYIPSRAANPRDTHKALYGVVKPVEDPFWDKFMPPSDWNCLCDAIPSDKQVSDTPQDLPEIPETFQVNPGKNGKLFSDAHPYYKDVNEGIVKDFIASI